ncbi:MAG: DsbC family protein [Pseudomonadota bacterium]
MRFATCLTVLLACASCASAESPDADAVRKKIAEKIPGIELTDVREAAIAGYYEVKKGSAYGYVTRDGKYLFEGDLVNLETGEPVTENQRRGERLKVLKRFGPDEVVEFAPKKTDYTVTVFTDIDCGYCRKLHQEMRDYNAQGIAIRYMFFPRSGPRTDSFFKAEAVMCAADRKQALTKAKMGIDLGAGKHCKNPVQKQYAAAEELGVNATPLMVLPNGDLVRGYVPATALAVKLATGEFGQVN